MKLKNLMTGMALLSLSAGLLTGCSEGPKASEDLFVCRGTANREIIKEQAMTKTPADCLNDLIRDYQLTDEVVAIDWEDLSADTSDYFSLVEQFACAKDAEVYYSRKVEQSSSYLLDDLTDRLENHNYGGTNQHQMRSAWWDKNNAPVRFFKELDGATITGHTLLPSSNDYTITVDRREVSGQELLTALNQLTQNRLHQDLPITTTEIIGGDIDDRAGVFIHKPTGGYTRYDLHPDGSASARDADYFTLPDDFGTHRAMCSNTKG